jgi:hypothetical protein
MTVRHGLSVVLATLMVALVGLVLVVPWPDKDGISTDLPDRGAISPSRQTIGVNPETG